MLDHSQTQPFSVYSIDKAKQR